MGSSSWQSSLSSTKSSPGVRVSSRSRIFRRRFLNGLQSRFSSFKQKLWRGGEESHLKSSGKSAVSRSTLRGPVGKITKPQTIANRGMANIRLQKKIVKAWLSSFLLSPWVVEVNHVLCDHLVVDRPLQGVGEQADHILLDLVLCQVLTLSETIFSVPLPLTVFT